MCVKISKAVPDNFGASSRHLNVNDRPRVGVRGKVDLRKFGLQRQQSILVSK